MRSAQATAVVGDAAELACDVCPACDTATSAAVAGPAAGAAASGRCLAAVGAWRHHSLEAADSEFAGNALAAPETVGGLRVPAAEDCMAGW
eukprot:scaffold18_cov401-Prasinococcus_capsulatus_cf.AAC.2